jgi:ferritin-like metal-binding protein YciE
MAEQRNNDELVLHLKDVHALEEQAIKTFERAVELTEDEQLCETYRQHLDQSHEHAELIAERIKAHEVKPSAVKDLTMRSGAIGLRQLAEIPPDTPVKLAMHLYSLEHLEIASYEFLARIARGAGDQETVEAAEQILEQEREAAEQVQSGFDRCVELLGEQAEKAEASKREEDEASKGKERSEQEEPSPA